ncbi:DUF305 domain-containing protein [Nordella sp. HKS 07]|uniref:CopM family metallochaperone n=1 Tax=Nordella sp. HKS 07 TaxID=2712222 RepID=UPI0013E0FB5B|nr:DUF305 domain-containing protein [Nordella sp. HKS 07]QIG47188.1 DUF305 domain-containing protein [Nordella sp. HKS 07]
MITLRLAIPLALSLIMGVGTAALAQDMGYEKKMMAAHKKMMDDMTAMKSTGDPDKDFAMMMLPHHQGAIDMAEVELKYGKDPMLKKMAQEIIDAQKKEIEELKKWQSEHH